MNMAVTLQGGVDERSESMELQGYRPVNEAPRGRRPLPGGLPPFDRLGGTHAPGRARAERGRGGAAVKSKSAARLLALVAVALFGSRPAVAGEDGEPSEILHVGAHAGVVFPQLQSELGTAAGIELDVDYRLGSTPVWALFGIGYAQPTVDGSLRDPRLADGDYTTETTQRELTLTLGALWRFSQEATRLGYYAGLGGRLWLLQTLTNGESGGHTFRENDETSGRLGIAVFGGAEFRIGPGAAVAELDIGGSDLPHVITGDVATTSITFTLGYRLAF